jgi:putative addiction module component (TIGR02574 family)
MSSRPKVVHSDPNILGGAPVFVGTRVALQNLTDCLEAGDTIDEFLTSFPAVTREQAIAAWNRHARRWKPVRILLDECLPCELADELVGHEAEILALPVAERMRLVEAIWDSISVVPEALPLTQWQKDELDRRLAEFEADPDSGATLEEVFARIRRVS